MAQEWVKTARAPLSRDCCDLKEAEDKLQRRKKNAERRDIEDYASLSDMLFEQIAFTKDDIYEALGSLSKKVKKNNRNQELPIHHSQALFEKSIRSLLRK